MWNYRYWVKKGENLSVKLEVPSEERRKPESETIGTEWRSADRYLNLDRGEPFIYI